MTDGQPQTAAAQPDHRTRATRRPVLIVDDLDGLSIIQPRVREAKAVWPSIADHMRHGHQ